MQQQHTIAGGGDVALNVLEGGHPDGPPIVFIHGWSQTAVCWDRQLDSPLADEFRLIALDLRGHGLSAAPSDPAAYTDGGAWAADVHAVIDTLGLERPVLVGWSYGGIVITDYLREHGDTALAGINFVGASIRMLPDIAGTLIGSAFPECLRAMIAPDLKTNIDGVRRFMDVCFAVKLSRADYERALCANMTVRTDVRLAAVSREIDADDVVRALRVPVLVSHGRQDPLTLPAMAERILALCPHARASWYEEAAHGPFLESPERYNAELAAFVRAARG